MYKLNKNQKTVLALIVLLVLILIGYFVFFSDQKIEVPAKVACGEAYLSFNHKHKTAMLDLQFIDKKEIKPAYADIYADWLVLKPLINEEKCSLFNKSQKLDKNIYLLSEALRKSEESYLEKKEDQALDYYLAATQVISQVKKDNDIFSADTDFLKIYVPIESIKASSDKESASDSLETLKLHFTEFKQYSPDQEYLETLKKMEKEIANIDKLLYGPEYINSKESLYNLFMELYYKY